MSNPRIGESTKKPASLTRDDLSDEGKKVHDDVLDAIVKHGHIYVEEVIRDVSWSKYKICTKHQVNLTNTIKDALAKNVASDRFSTRKELPAKDRYKLLATEEELKKLSNNQNLEVRGQVDHVVEIVDFSNLNLEDEKDD